MTWKMTTKNEQENDQKNGQENGPGKTARAISRRKQLEMARPCELARELIDDPIRIVALSERRESGRASLDSASLGAVACPPRAAANLRLRD
jgi:hypothetical protein